MLRKVMSFGLAVGVFVALAGAPAMAQQAAKKSTKPDNKCSSCIARGMAGTGTGQTSGASRETATAWCTANNFCK